MKIRNDLAKSVLTDFVTETFSGFEFTPVNVLNSLAVKMYVHNNFDVIAQVLSKDGYIDVTALEQFALKDIEKLGKFEVPAVGTRYLFNTDDVKRLIAKMKEQAE